MVATLTTAKIAAVAVPFLLALGFTAVVELTVARSREHILARSVATMAAGLASAAVIHAFNSYSSTRIHLAAPRFGSSRLLLAGVAVGATMTVLAALLFFLAERPAVGQWRVFFGLPYAMMANVFPALVEESGFRAGVVHFLDQLSGAPAALVGGSIPFGLAHLLGRVLGKPIVPMHILNATFAGLLFSAAYLRSGLLYAIGIHWGWNSLVRCWAALFELDPRGGVQIFEGSWTSGLVTLAAATFFLSSLDLGT